MRRGLCGSERQRGQQRRAPCPRHPPSPSPRGDRPHDRHNERGHMGGGVDPPSVCVRARAHGRGVFTAALHSVLHPGVTSRPERREGQVAGLGFLSSVGAVWVPVPTVPVAASSPAAWAWSAGARAPLKVTRGLHARRPAAAGGWRKQCRWDRRATRDAATPCAGLFIFIDTGDSDSPVTVFLALSRRHYQCVSPL